MKEALKELRAIIRMRDQAHWKPTEIREYALEDWIYRWLETIEYEQCVINEKYLNSEFQDFIKEHIAKKLSEEQLVDCIDFDTKKSIIKGQVTSIRRRSKN